MEDTAPVFGDNDGYAMSRVLSQFHVHENAHEHVVTRTADALEEHLLGLSFWKTTVRQYLYPVLKDGDQRLREIPVIVDKSVDERLVHTIEIEEELVVSRAAGSIRNADVLGHETILNLFVCKEKRLAAVIVPLGDGGFVPALEFDDYQRNGVLVRQEFGQQVVFPLRCLQAKILLKRLVIKVVSFFGIVDFQRAEGDVAVSCGGASHEVRLREVLLVSGLDLLRRHLFAGRSDADRTSGGRKAVFLLAIDWPRALGNMDDQKRLAICVA